MHLTLQIKALWDQEARRALKFQRVTDTMRKIHMGGKEEKLLCDAATSLIDETCDEETKNFVFHKIEFLGSHALVLALAVSKKADDVLKSLPAPNKSLEELEERAASLWHKYSKIKGAISGPSHTNRCRTLLEDGASLSTSVRARACYDLFTNTRNLQVGSKGFGLVDALETLLLVGKHTQSQHLRRDVAQEIVIFLNSYGKILDECEYAHLVNRAGNFCAAVAKQEPGLAPQP